MTLPKIDYEGKIKRKDFELIIPKKPYVLMDLSKLNLNRFNMYYDNHELRYLEKRLRK